MLIRRTLLTAALLLAGASFAPQARADATSDARKTIQAAYDKMNAAAAKKDVNGILAYYAPDYEHVNQRGQKTTLAAMRQQMPQLLQMMKSIKATTAIKKFVLQGSQATVAVASQGEMVGVDPQTKKAVKIVIFSSDEDLWVKGAKGWMQKRSKTLSSKQTVDGKPVPGG